MKNKIFSGVICLTIFLNSGLLAQTPINFKDAIKLAIKNNLDLSIEKNSTIQKKGSLTSSWGDFDFNLNLSSTLSDSETPSSSSLDGVNAASAIITKSTTYEASLSKKFTWGAELTIPYSYSIERSNSSYSRIPKTHEPSLGFEIKWPIFLGFSPSYFKKDIIAAKLDLKIAKRKYGEKLSDTVFKAVEYYLDTIRTQEEIKIKNQALYNVKENLKYVTQKHKLGKASLIDELEAKAAALKKEEELSNSKVKYADKRDELSLHIFADPSKAFVVDASFAKAEKFTPGETFEELLKKAFSHRLELKRARGSLFKARVEKKAASKDRLPNLDLTYSHTQKGLNSTMGKGHNEITQRKFTSWSAEIELEQPLLMYAKKGAYKMKSLRLLQEKLKVEQTKRDIELELLVAIRKFQAGWDRIQALETAKVAEMEKFKGQKQHFSVGKISLYELNQSQEDKEKAELELLKAKIDYQKDIYKFHKATGTLVQSLNL